MSVQLIEDRAGNRGWQARVNWQTKPGQSRYFAVTKYGYRAAKALAEKAERQLRRRLT